MTCSLSNGFLQTMRTVDHLLRVPPKPVLSTLELDGVGALLPLPLSWAHLELPTIGSAARRLDPLLPAK